MLLQQLFYFSHLSLNGDAGHRVSEGNPEIPTTTGQ